MNASVNGLSDKINTLYIENTGCIICAYGRIYAGKMTASIREKVDYWLDMANYDLVTAKAMLEAKRYLYVGFMCHQVAEKSLKALFWHTRKLEPPYTHNLLVLAEQSQFDFQEKDEFVILLNELMPLNLQARYPDDKELLLKTLKKKRCEDLYRRTKELNKWIKKSLK